MEFTEHEVRLSQGTVKCYKGGTGLPLLYFHSAGGVRITPPIKALLDKHTIYMPVVPGFDGTKLLNGIDTYQDLAKLFAEFADTVIKAQCDVLGHSFGGRLAIWFASLYPEKTRLLVLEAPSGFRPAGMKDVDPGNADAMLRAMYAHPEKLPPNQKPREMAVENRKMAEHYHKNRNMEEALVGQLPKLRAVTLILRGTKDGRVPDESVLFLKAKIPTSHLIYVYDAAHAIEVDQPERFLTLVGDFLARGQGFLVNAGTGEELADAELA